MEGTIGEIRMFAGNFAPRYWAFCQGQIITISSNQALFSVISNFYGGDGRTTFALPDLRGRVPVQQGNGAGLTPYQLAQRGGVETVNLDVSQIPSHTHTFVSGNAQLTGQATATMQVNNSDGSDVTPNGKFIGMDNNGGGIYANSADGSSTLNAQAIQVDTSGLQVASVGGSNANTGGSKAHYNIQPYLGINFIIALEGLYPDRN